MKRWEKEDVIESHPQEYQLWDVPILLKMVVSILLKIGIDLWLLQVWTQLLTNFLYICFVFKII